MPLDQSLYPPPPPPPPPPTASYSSGSYPVWTPPQTPRRNPWIGVLAMAVALPFVVGGVYVAASLSRAHRAILPPNADSAVADVTAQLYDGEALGTGIVLSPDGYIVTNNHVIMGAEKVTVQIGGTGRTYVVSVVGTDPSDDIALLQIPHSPPLSRTPLGDSTALSVGEPVTAIGNALGEGGAPKRVSGKISALNQSITAVDEHGQNPEILSQMIEFDAPIQPGDSGGPLFNSQGRTVGMTTAGSTRFRYRTAANIGYAIPMNMVVSIAQRIENGEFGGNILSGHSAFIGVDVESSDSGIGVIVDAVVPHSPAATIGLSPGDTLLLVDGSYITSLDSLRAILQRHKPGDTVSISWDNDYGISHSGSIKLASGPPP